MDRSRPCRWIAIVLVAGLAAASAAMAIDVQIGGTAADHGKYLVSAVGGCNDCHTPLMMMGGGPPMPDTSRLLSGHPMNVPISSAPELRQPWGWAGSMTDTAFGGPWGVSFAMNLTPDMQTGIGPWSEEAFVSSLKTGKHMGSGRPINPPMPWQTYRQMDDADLKAIYAYLRTIPPIGNKVPETIPPEQR